MRTKWLLAALIAVVLSLAAGPVLSQEKQTQEEEKAAEKKQEKKAPGKEAAKAPKQEAAGVESEELSAAERRAISRVLRNLSSAMEGNSPRQFTVLLDERFYDFPRFEDGVTEFLKGSAEMRLFLREVSTEVKGDRATLLVDAEMTFASKDQPTAQQKRTQRIQFDFVRTGKGWKIYEISPRGFFTR
jgi:hypothetical protein